MSSITKGVSWFVVIPQHQKGHLIYVPSSQKIVSLHGVVFDEIFPVRYHTHPVRIKRHLLYDQHSSIIRTLHHLMNKLATL